MSVASALRFEALGERVLVPFRARRVPAARVLWCNFELARDLGFDVPRENRLDAKLGRALVKAFSLRADPTGEVTLYADRYYGSGMEDHRGSARGGIDLARNVFIKGIGKTPLAVSNNPWHSNGACHITQCVAEALFGEIDAHLFTAGASRVLAILDQHEQILFEGKMRHAAIMVRVGVPFRPAHLVRPLGEDLSDLPALFVRLTRLGGTLVTKRGRPDYAATMRRLLALHARTAAEQVRWRVLHGAITTSNIGLFGEMIDLNSQCTQARTAPISVQRVRRTRDGSFGGEHLARGQELALLYLSIIESQRPNVVAIDCASELNALYEEALATELLLAMGLPRALGEMVTREAPSLVRRYRDLLLSLMALRNPGSTNARISTCERIGVVDVFGFLATGDARLQGKKAEAKKVLARLAKVHREILDVVRSIVGARRFGKLLLEMRERAAFENRPIEDGFRTRFLAEASALDTCDAKQLPEAVATFLNTRIARSVRSVEAMLRAPRRRMANGVEHVLRSKDGRDWAIEIRFVRQPAPKVFRYSFDHGKTVSIARPQRGRVRIPVPASCGVLEGESVLPFAFAVPSKEW